MANATQTDRFRFWLWLIRFVGLIVPRRLRADWRQEWEAELRYREALLAEWDRLNWQTKLDLLWRSTSAFWDALWLQPKRLEDEMFQDLRFGVRMLLKHKRFTTVAVLSLALGIGASVTVFSVVNALLLRPLPFENPDSLVWIENNLGPTQSAKTIQVGHLLELQQESQVFSDLAAYDPFSQEGNDILSSNGEPERLTRLAVTERFFPLLGVRPYLGRLFTAEECRWNGPKIVLLSHRLWQRRFAADPGIVGRSLTINDAAVTVVGVLPPTFDFTTVFQPGGRADLFSPFPLSTETNRRGNTLFIVGRLKPGATVEAARAEVTTVAARSNGTPQRNRFLPNVITLRQHVSGTYRNALWVLAAAVGMVMLVVCANLSSLLLTRAATREKEIAIRVALGAQRGRLIRQMLTESLVLSCSGAALGLALAIAGTRLLAKLEAVNLPLRELVRVDAKALGITMLIALITGIVFGLVPALRASALALTNPLKEGTGGSSESKRQGQIRNTLIVAEVALACVLLLGAGLLLRSFLRVLDVDLGFQPQRTIALRVDPNSYQTERDRHLIDLSFRQTEQARRLAYFDEALQQVRTVPGVEAAGLTDALPLGRNREWELREKGRVYPRGEVPNAYVHMVSEGYLHAMGIPLRAGRDFTASDNRTSMPVVLINETLARRLWPGENPLGRTIYTEQVDRQVIGVVEDVRHLSLERQGGPEMYLPIRQTHYYSAMHLVVRGGRSLAELTSATRAAIQPINPNMPVNEIRVVQEIVDRSVSPRRFIVTLLVGFAGFALILASLGIYGVISYSVNQRRREIGIRMALGATAGRLQRGILAHTLKLVAVGVALGASAFWAIRRVIQSLLFEVTTADPVTFAAVLTILASVATLAGYLPARKASRIDPATALRAE